MNVLPQDKATTTRTSKEAINSPFHDLSIGTQTKRNVNETSIVPEVNILPGHESRLPRTLLPTLRQIEVEFRMALTTDVQPLVSSIRLPLVTIVETMTSTDQHVSPSPRPERNQLTDIPFP